MSAGISGLVHGRHRRRRGTDFAAGVLSGGPAADAGRGQQQVFRLFRHARGHGSLFRSGKLLLLPALFAVAGAFPGAYLGAEVLKRMDEDVVRTIMLVAIPCVAALVLLKRNSPAQPRPMTGMKYALCLAIGLACGFYDGFFGPGTGTILILLFTWVAGMDMVTASGTSKPVNLASNAAALCSMLIGKKVLFALAVPAMLCSVAGGFLGSKMAIRVGARLVRGVMLVVLVMLLGKLAYEWLIA